ncbi:MAG: hypothetical protein C5B60_07680 [Chloroflexi bacterium]|nr:MAG: hypothetical protein C5B60_07680 [Chloroflexota bacterium]
MARSDTGKAHSDYPLMTEEEHEFVRKRGDRPFSERGKTLTPEEGRLLEQRIDARLKRRTQGRKITGVLKDVRKSHHSYRYTAAGRREKRQARKPS